MGTHSQILKQLRSHPLEKGRDSVCLAPLGGTSVHERRDWGGNFYSIQESELSRERAPQ